MKTNHTLTQMNKAWGGRDFLTTLSELVDMSNRHVGFKHIPQDAVGSGKLSDLYGAILSSGIRTEKER